MIKELVAQNKVGMAEGHILVSIPKDQQKDDFGFDKRPQNSCVKALILCCNLDLDELTHCWFLEPYATVVEETDDAFIKIVPEKNIMMWTSEKK